MRRARPLLCDACGGPLDTAAAAALVLAFDERQVLVSAAVDHRACVPLSAQPGGLLEVITATTAATPAATARLRGLARVVALSPTIRKLARLTAGGGTPV